MAEAKLSPSRVAHMDVFQMPARAEIEEASGTGRFLRFVCSDVKGSVHDCDFRVDDVTQCGGIWDELIFTVTDRTGRSGDAHVQPETDKGTILAVLTD